MPLELLRQRRLLGLERLLLGRHRQLRHLVAVHVRKDGQRAAKLVADREPRVEVILRKHADRLGGGDVGALRDEAERDRAAHALLARLERPRALDEGIRPAHHPQAIDQMMAELVDRFGPLPDPVRNLFVFIELKQLCRSANVEKIDAGPKGISLSFRDDQFARPEQLIDWIAGQGGLVQLRPDHRLFVKSSLEKPEMQVPACREVIQQLISLL